MKYNMYPKQFRNARIPIEKNKCFVLMPFNPTFDYTYGEVKQYLSNCGYVCNRADELSGSVPIMSNILKEILKAHFVIADLTGQNANVFYELGIAHSFKDAQHIILIAQSIDDIPFDIRHLRTILYTDDNLKFLTTNIVKAIKENSHYYSFFEALQRRSIISSINDDKYDYIDDLQNHLSDRLNIITDFLNGNTENYGESDAREILNSLLGILYSTPSGVKKKQLRATMRIVSAVLCNCEEFQYPREVVAHLLHEIKLENYSININEILYLQSELAVTLAENKVFFREAMSWIIDYFMRSKSATVDLNRYNLERFLMTSDDNEVDQVIVNSVLHENYYVREHMADIVGEKKIVSGYDALIAQLSRENNIYSTSSIITALGKIGNPAAYNSIVEWFQSNKDKIMSTEHYFILKHIHIALKRLKITNDFTAWFESEFSEYLTPSAIF